MRVHRNLPATADAPLALTIGNFDGVHRGHQAMLARLIEAAEDLDLPPAVLTFDPPPREFFARAKSPQRAAPVPARLSTLRQKLEIFRSRGVVRTYVARFDAGLAAQSPDTFIDEMLVRRLGVRWVLVGEDFRFGKARAGDLGTLRRAARSFSVEALATVAIDGERASSTAVRTALGAGDLARASALLGRSFSISGRVAYGRKLGRTLGFPTANIALRRAPPLTGIFAVRVHGLAAHALTGVASIGVRPTVSTEAVPLLEIYIFDFDEDIYGRRVAVEFMHKLRDEERYPDLDALARQIRIDAAQARGYFDTLTHR